MLTRRHLNRRDFLRASGGATAGLALYGPARAPAGTNDGPYGDLVPDPGGLLFWFDDTQGGEARRGQIYRLIPRAGERDRRGHARAVLRVDERNDLDLPDNMIVTPWGDIWLAEDGGGENRIVGITPEGETYVFARNAYPA